jgi:hypothetical protein
MSMDKVITKKKWTPRKIITLSLSVGFLALLIFLLLSIKSGQLRIKKDHLSLAAVSDGRFRVDLQFVEGAPGEIRRGQTLHLRLELGSREKALRRPGIDPGVNHDL